MDDATQNLAPARAGEFDGDASPEALAAWERYAALPARYGPWSEYREQDAFTAGYDAARRPPVNPEQREAAIEHLAGHIEAAQHPHHVDEVGADALDQNYLATVAFDALLARFSLPVPTLTREETNA